MRFAVPLLFLAWSGPLLANPSAAARSLLDLYYIPDAELKATFPGVGSGQVDGDGYGLRTMLPIPGNPLVLTGAWQTVEYDGLPDALRELRGGFGVLAGGGFGLYGEYVQQDFDGEDIEGWSGQARFLGPLGPQWQLSASLGWTQLDGASEDVSGTDIAAGLQYVTEAGGGFFAEYRILDLEGEDSGIEARYSDLRIGLRVRY